MWKILVVDDEPDVLLVTKLAIGRSEIAGEKVELLQAKSMAEALQTLQTHDDIAVAIVDVIMDTDDAGFVLCQKIREELKNDTVQIFLRTGQPDGPPKALLDRWNICGHIAKPEATSERLSEMIETGIRAYIAAGGSHTNP